jgi:predicted DsbA family dithiol-disulfide isomerase
LHPDTPAEGLALADLFRGRDLSGMHRAMSARMAAAGLEYADRARTYNSRLAQELACWAETQAGGAAIHKALFRAYFVENRNLAQGDVLLDVAAAAGLDVAQARNALEQRTFRTQVDRDWEYSHQNGITGVPAFLARNQVIVGCQPYTVLEQFVRQLLN